MADGQKDGDDQRNQEEVVDRKAENREYHDEHQENNENRVQHGLLQSSPQHPTSGVCGARLGAARRKTAASQPSRRRPAWWPCRFSIPAGCRR